MTSVAAVDFPEQRVKRRSPAFGIVLGYTLMYLSAMVIIPLGGLFLRAAGVPWDKIVESVTSERALGAYQVTFGTAFAAAIIDGFFGLIIAWVLVRYEFPGRRLLDAIVDLPFALPTAVAGIALTTIFAKNGWLGRPLGELGIEVAFTQIGITIALAFIGLPFVVRTVQPVLDDLDADAEEAALSLGASRWQVFRRVIFPEISPALISGSTLAFARGLGEYGSVVFISGNMPMKTEIIPLLIVTKLEQYDYSGATAIGASMLVISFFLLFVINGLQWLDRRRHGQVNEPGGV